MRVQVESGKSEKPERLIEWLSHSMAGEALAGGNSSFSHTAAILLHVSLGHRGKNPPNYTTVLLSFLLIVSLAFQPFDAVKDVLCFEGVLTTRKIYTAPYIYGTRHSDS